MGIIVRGTKAAGGTAFTASTSAKASEVNTDFDTAYSEINGNLDNDNIKSSAAIAISKLATINPEDIDDYSATAAEAATAVDPGVSDSEMLAADVSDELERLRYKLEEIALGINATRENASGTTTTYWGDLPARGGNLINNASFSVKLSATSTDAPDGWTKEGTPTSLDLADTAVGEGGGKELNIVAAAADDGVSQTFVPKASTCYLVLARVKKNSGTGNPRLTTTGADATSDFRDITITTTSTSFTTLKGVVQSDSIPANLKVSIEGTDACDFDVSHVAIYECTTDFLAPPGGGLLVRDSDGTTATTFTNGSWASVPGCQVTITPPGPGYGCLIMCTVTVGAPAGGGGNLDMRLRQSIDAGGNTTIADGVTIRVDQANAEASGNFNMIVTGMQGGAVYAFSLEGQGTSNAVSSSPVLPAAGDDGECSMIVHMMRMGV